MLLLQLLVVGGGAWAASWSGDVLEPILSAERRRAVAEAARTAAAAATVKAETATRLLAVREEITEVKAQAAGLQAQLLSVLAKDDPVALKAVMAEVEACEVRQDAAEDEAALLEKLQQEAGREADTWKKRVSTLDTAARMEMKVLLATPAEIENREHRLESARKDIEYERSQIRKQRSRREATMIRLGELRSRLAEARRTIQHETSALAPGADANLPLMRALADQVQQLQRATNQQQEWFLLLKSVEDRAWQNLAFADMDLQVHVAYAEALARKSASQAMVEAEAAEAEADAALAAARVQVEARQALVTRELAAATREADAALQSLQKTGSESEQRVARNAYARAQEVRARWEAESDFLKGFLSWRKAGSAFAREKTERARSLAEKKRLSELTQELQGLEESAKTSEEYTNSVTSMLEKLATQVLSARQALGLPAAQLDGLAETVAAMVQAPVADSGPTIDSLLAGIAALGGAGPAVELTPGETLDRRSTTTTCLLLRIGEQALAQGRLAIAQEWLNGTRAAIALTRQRAASVLWEQQNPLLSWTSALELTGLLWQVGGDARFLLRVYSLGLAAKAGYASAWLLLAALVAVLALVWLGRWLRSRTAPFAADRVYWFAARLVAFCPALLLAGALAPVLFPGNLFTAAVGLALWVAVLWWVLRTILVGVWPPRRFPPVSSVAGAVARALCLALTTGMVALVLWLLAGQVESRWGLQGLVRQAWLLSVLLLAIWLVLHPRLVGRLVRTDSGSHLARVVGHLVLLACLFAGLLTGVPFLLALDNLASTVLRVLLLSLLLAAIGVALPPTARWLRGRPAGPRQDLASIDAILAFAVWVGTAAVIVRVWSRLFDQVLFSADAPAPVQQLAQLLIGAKTRAGQVWSYQLTTEMTVRSLVFGLAVIVASVWGSRLVRRALLERVLVRTPMDQATQQSFAAILGYVVIVAGVVAGLNVAGSSPKNFAMVAGALTVGLGFGLQNVVNNFISSLMIHFGRTIRVGDYIEVGGQRGTVRDIGLRSTLIFTDDGVSVLVPNGSFISSNVTNWSVPVPTTRVHVPVSVLRQADRELVRVLLCNLAAAHPDILPSPVPNVELRSVAGDKVNLELLAWTRNPARIPTIVGELSLEVDHQLRAQGFLG